MSTSTCACCRAASARGWPSRGCCCGPSNTLLLDEPTNHLDLDSKEVLLDALVDYGGTLIFVSHDRYFVERLATKIIEVGHGTAIVYPGTYKEFLWHKEHGDETARDGRVGQVGRAGQERRDGQENRRRSVLDTRARHGASASGAEVGPRASEKSRAGAASTTHQQKRKVDADARKKSRADQARKSEIDSLETRIAECEQAIKEIEQTMAAPGFYEDRAAAQPIIDKHQALMWTVGDLIHQWEELQLHKSVI